MATTRMNNFGRKGWWIIIYTLLLYLISSTGANILNVTTTAYSNVLGVPASSLLVFAAIGGFVALPICIIVGNAIVKKGVKLPTIVLLILMAVNWFAWGRCNSIVSYAITATLIAALSNTLNLVPTQQFMNNWFPKKKGIALGWATAGMPIDAAISVGIFQYLMTHFGIQTPFTVWAVISIVLTIILIFFVKSYPEEAGAYPDNEVITEEERQRNLKLFNEYKTEFTAGRLLRTKQFWAIVIIFGFMFMGLIGDFAQLVPRLMYVGIGQNSAILWMTFASIVGIPTSFMWGFIDQKIGTKKTIIFFTLIWTITMFLSSIGSGAVSIGISVASVIFLSCMHGGMGNLMPSLIIQIFGRYDFGAANKLVVPLVVVIRTLSLLLIPIMLGIAGEANGNIGFRNAFFVFGVLSVISLITIICLKDKCIGREYDAQ